MLLLLLLVRESHFPSQGVGGGGTALWGRVGLPVRVCRCWEGDGC